jgi:hypothetical protein
MKHCGLNKKHAPLFFLILASLAIFLLPGCSAGQADEDIVSANPQPHPLPAGEFLVPEEYYQHHVTVPEAGSTELIEGMEADLAALYEEQDWLLAEYEELTTMLKILEDMGDNPQRMNTYRKLIEGNEAGRQEIESMIERRIALIEAFDSDEPRSDEDSELPPEYAEDHLP